MYNQHQGNAPGSYQYVFSDFSNTHSTHIPKVENQFAVTHQQDFPYQLQQSILGDKLAIGSENIKIYVPDNYVSNKSLSPSRSHFKKTFLPGHSIAIRRHRVTRHLHKPQARIHGHHQNSSTSERTIRGRVRGPVMIRRCP